jgi:cytochrome c oxidase subunit 2
MHHDSVWIISVALMGLLLVVFAFVFVRSQNREADYTPLQERAYRVRTRFFFGLVFTLFPAMLYNLVDLPYGPPSTHSRAVTPKVIDVVGRQWSWSLSDTKVAVGQPVEFRVTSADVNHGFGIYDVNMRLVGQVQAMPGYVNTLRHTFNAAGKYRALCMEYCGIVHHTMFAEITVVDGAGE